MLMVFSLHWSIAVIRGLTLLARVRHVVNGRVEVARDRCAIRCLCRSKLTKWGVEEDLRQAHSIVRDGFLQLLGQVVPQQHARGETFGDVHVQRHPFYFALVAKQRLGGTSACDALRDVRRDDIGPGGVRLNVQPALGLLAIHTQP
jgi:hypothetical protein